MSPSRRVAAAESRLAGRGPSASGKHSSPLAVTAASDACTGLAARGKSGGLGGGRAGEGAPPRSAGYPTRLRPRPPRAGARASGGREARRPRGGSGPRAPGRQAPGGASAPAAPSAEPAGARRRGGRGRPGADPERRRVCGRRPPRARLLPPRVTRRPSARTSSIRPDRPPAPRPSITPAQRGLRGRRRRAPRAGGWGGEAVRRARELATPSEERDPGEACVHQGAGRLCVCPRTAPRGSEEAFFYQSTNI